MATEGKSEAFRSGSMSGDSKKKSKKRKREKERETLDSNGGSDNGAKAVRFDDSFEQGVANEPEKQPSLDVAIEVVSRKPEKTLPIVGYFPSRYDPNRLNSGNQERQPSIQFYRNAQRAKLERGEEKSGKEKGKSSERLELVVHPTGGNVDFVGTSYRGEASAPQECNYVLGVFDKETLSMKVVPIAGNKIFRLEPKVPGLVTTIEDHPVVEDLNKYQKRNALTAEYGTKTSMTQDKKIRALYEGFDADSQTDLGKKIESAPVNKEALESTSGLVTRNIPMHNTSATEPQGAYPLDMIILSGEWQYLQDIHEASKLSNPDYPFFVCNRVEKLQAIKDNMQKETLTGILSYISHLVSYKDQHSFDSRATKHHRIPEILWQKFNQMFEPDRKRLSPDKLSLLLSYVLVLTLHADNFRTDPADIAKDLKMNISTLRTHYQNLGCKLEREKTKFLATLPVPLQFPEVRRWGRGSGRGRGGGRGRGRGRS